MKYYSEITKEFYDDEKKLLKEEKAYQEKLDREAKEAELKQKAYEEDKSKLVTQIEEADSVLEMINDDIAKCNEEYSKKLYDLYYAKQEAADKRDKLLRQYNAEYGRYSDEDALKAAKLIMDLFYPW